jgi:hypothetical protein
LFRVRTELTPLAAAGLSSIMLGATIITLMGGSCGCAPARGIAKHGLIAGPAAPA